eukprot:SAG11_NODE_420_length_9631_cov_12.805558_2_plen_76_part_00
MTGNVLKRATTNFRKSNKPDAQWHRKLAATGMRARAMGTSKPEHVPAVPVPAVLNLVAHVAAACTRSTCGQITSE